MKAIEEFLECVFIGLLLGVAVVVAAVVFGLVLRVILWVAGVS